MALACVPALAASAAAAQPAPRRDSLVVTYLANEGVMLSSGGATVLIDALFGEGLSGYGVVSLTTRRLLEGAAPPFTGVNAVLATHVHDDHFNASAVLTHLQANPRATFVSTAQAVQRVRAAAGPAGGAAIAGRLVVADVALGERRPVVMTGGATIYTLGMPHGGEGPTTNVGFVVHVGGFHVLHVGDSSEGMESVRTLRLGELGIDVALLPPHYLTDPALQDVVRREVRPRHIAVVHPPVGFLARLRDRWSRVVRDIASAFPNARIFSREMETLVVKDAN
jgi:L-ascorbate metabolism protein UlaG (beta-lactamase superfamily)